MYIICKAICSEPMGIESGLLNNNMISVSSSIFENSNPLDVSLNSETGWAPFTASASQWIQVKIPFLYYYKIITIGLIYLMNNTCTHIMKII